MRKNEILADARRMAEAFPVPLPDDCVQCNPLGRPVQHHPDCVMFVVRKYRELQDTADMTAPAQRRGTSIDAADLIAPRVGSQADHVLETIEFAYPVPLTDQEIYERRPTMITGAAQSTVRARRIALMDGGWVMPVDEKGVTAKGRTCIRWGLTPAAVEARS